MKLYRPKKKERKGLYSAMGMKETDMDTSQTDEMYGNSRRKMTRTDIRAYLENKRVGLRLHHKRILRKYTVNT